MTQTLCLEREISAPNLEVAVERLTSALQTESFGVLTRIDFHAKMKEKLGKDVRPTVILGACNPALAYGAYQANPLVTALIPCNAVVHEKEQGRYLIELTKPSVLLAALNEAELTEQAGAADEALQRALEKVGG